MSKFKVQSAIVYIVLCTLIFALSSCAPEQQIYPPPVADEAPLPLKSWVPKEKPKAVIIALHGFNDYSHAFQGTGTFFKAHDITVIAYDQRGFGKAPHTGLWANEQNLIADLAQCVKRTSRRWPHTPIYILGESMGGAVAVVALADSTFPKVQGLILESPALWGDGTMNPIFRTTLWLAAHTLPSYKLSGRELHILASNNMPMLIALGRDPLVIKETRIDTIYGLVHLMDDAYEQVPNIKTPVLLLYGAQDQVIPHEPIDAARRRFSIPIEYIYYPDGYHMLLRDLQGQTVMRDILNWIEVRKYQQ